MRRHARCMPSEPSKACQHSSLFVWEEQVPLPPNRRQIQLVGANPACRSEGRGGPRQPAPARARRRRAAVHAAAADAAPMLAKPAPAGAPSSRYCRSTGSVHRAEARRPGAFAARARRMDAHGSAGPPHPAPSGHRHRAGPPEQVDALSLPSRLGSGDPQRQEQHPVEDVGRMV